MKKQKAKNKKQKYPFDKLRILSLLKDNSKPKIFGFVFLLFTFYFLLFTSVSAHTSGVFWKIGEPIVSCGYDPNSTNPDVKALPTEYKTPCTQCEILHTARHVIDFIMIAAAPILATFFFVWAGVLLMLGGANPGMLSQGKSIFKNTFIGISIVMLSWLITNTLIRTLINPAATQGTNWWEISCDKIGLKGGSGGQCVDYGGGNFECVGGSNGGNSCFSNADCL